MNPSMNETSRAYQVVRPIKLGGGVKIRYKIKIILNKIFEYKISIQDISNKIAI